jgi:FtsH-binding integral membrane protein
VLVPAGLAAALSGMWMAAFAELPAHDNTALMWIRLLFGSVMVAGLVLGLTAIRRRDVRTHQRWMARAYAVGQGAGTQALVLGPMVLFVDQPGGTLKAIGMAFAWVLNLAVAEWLVRRSQSRQSRRRV